MTSAIARTFASLEVPNYRRYVYGQLVSVTGTWMQTIAEIWLVVQLTGSGLSVGLAAALQFLPILLFGAWGGVLADRIAKRRLLMVTQTLMALPALGLWALTLGGTIELWMVYALVLARGTINAVDNPGRHSFAIELVGPSRVVNAVSLNSVVIHVASIIGPALAGLVIALVGVGTCFLLNVLSFAVMIAVLARMDPAGLHTPRPSTERGAAQLASALREVGRVPGVRIPLAMMAVIGILGFNFPVLLPLLAQVTWEGTAGTFALLTVAMGVGSVGGALLTGAYGRADPTVLLGAAAAFGTAGVLVGVAPTLPLQVVALAALGGASVSFAAGVSSAVQLRVSPSMRGRVMALYAVVYLGSRAVGGPIVGWIADAVDPRASFCLAGVATLATAAGARLAFARVRLQQI